MDSGKMLELEERLRSIQPALVYKIEDKDLEIKVFGVKRMNDPCWGNAPLYSLLRLARLSYLRYGQIQSLDQYDNKAVIYAARATYMFHDKMVSEWLSLRFAPYSGIPDGIEDIGFYQYNGRPIKEIINRKFLRPRGLSWNDCVSGSRICGINPYLMATEATSELSRHNRFAGLCFAALHRQFFREYPKYKILISQIPDSFLENVLATLSLPKLRLTTAYRALKCDKKILGLNRGNRYIYKFPMYFLNPDDVLAVFRRLYLDGRITEATLAYYFDGRLTGLMVRSGNWPSMEKLNNLGLIFSAEGRIHGSELTGEDIRNLLIFLARDGPKLRIVRMADLKRVINKMLSDSSR